MKSLIGSAKGPDFPKTTPTVMVSAVTPGAAAPLAAAAVVPVAPAAAVVPVAPAAVVALAAAVVAAEPELLLSLPQAAAISAAAVSRRPALYVLRILSPSSWMVPAGGRASKRRPLRTS